MQFRSSALVALGLTVVALPLGAQQFRYAPGSARYHASVVTKMTQDVGGRRVDDEITQSQRLTIELGAVAGDTLRIGVTVDSAAVNTRSSGLQDVTPLVGLRIDGRISSLGAHYSSAIVGRGIGPTGVLIANELARFLPRLRGDLRAGLVWTDTTTERMDMLGIPVERHVLTTSHVRGDTSVAGQRAWKIDRKSAVQFYGNGVITGQQIRLLGTSISEGVLVVSRAGRYLGGNQSDQVRTTFSMPANRMEVGMTQSQVTRVEFIP